MKSIMQHRGKPLFERRSARWWAVSILAHSALILLLAQIVFRYPIGQLMGFARQEIKPEKLHYIVLPAPATESSGGGGAPEAGATAAPMRAPTTTPAQTPAPVRAEPPRAEAAGGTGSGRGVDGAGVATGVVPVQPDPRIRLHADRMVRTPRTVAQDVDSIMDVTIGVYVDSMNAVAQQRRPTDWTIKGKDGEKWGLDQEFIHLGKYKIPSALLALLPLNKAGGGSPIETRTAAYIRRDVLENAQRAISEDEFRAAVKRIRERKEREKREAQLASDSKSDPSKPQPQRQQR